VVRELHSLVSMKTNNPRIPIASCIAVEGPLYAVQLEDSVGHCYDWSFEARGVDGTRYVLRDHRVEGTVRGEEGFLCPNYQARSQAQRLVDRVEARGSIDPALWDVVTDRDSLRELMDSWGVVEAAREKEDDLSWEASGRPAHGSVRR
jgi:hypothetical protein